jgi:hypothetical protein
MGERSLTEKLEELYKKSSEKSDGANPPPANLWDNWPNWNNWPDWNNWPNG